MQLSLFGNHVEFPHSYEELQALYDEHLKKENEDSDAFEYNDLSTNGRSYSFYGVKVFEFYPGPEGTAKLKLTGAVINRLGLTSDVKKPEAMYTISEKALPSDKLLLLIEDLQKEKQRIFRNTITEEFACCHDFMACSDAKECLHPEDRFFNGCTYRTNLEAGRIFYGKNRNVD